MSSRIRSIIVEGLDRTGKSTLVRGIQERLGFFQVIHYEKPLVLKAYRDQAIKMSKLMRYELSEREEVRQAQRRYQEASFTQMLHLLSGPGRFILDRAHLGEQVYSPRYRNYDGSYVFDLERKFTHDLGSDFTETTLLVLLHSSNLDLLEDDGLSLDYTKRGEEQADFLKAFDRSTIKNKLKIDVHDGHGGYVSEDMVLTQVLISL